MKDMKESITYPLSAIQWEAYDEFLEDPKLTQHNVTVCMPFERSSAQRFLRAMQNMLDEQRYLHIHLVRQGDDIMICEDWQMPNNVHYLRMSDAEWEAAQPTFTKPFDVFNEACVRLYLVETDTQCNVIMESFHLFFDGISHKALWYAFEEAVQGLPLFKPGEGLYTDMNAIRRDEDTDNIHSIYVDQWDWERIITKEERNVEFLKKIVRLIFQTFKLTEDTLINAFPEKKLQRTVPDDIFFISSQELEDLYPDKRPKDREHLITKEKGAVFITQIGKKLKSGKPHDGRSPDYDDWELNGDILFWYEPLGISIELSSMGIRVDEKSLEKQLKEANAENRKEFLFHRMLLNGELPLTIGGGLGQSRICMYFMKTVHIGEVQSSVWPEEMVQEFREKGIEFL